MCVRLKTHLPIPTQASCITACASSPSVSTHCRLSTVQSADQIVVMQAGRIAEKGTHNELLARQGCYSELMSSQEMILGASV